MEGSYTGKKLLTLKYLAPASQNISIPPQREDAIKQRDFKA